MLIKLITLVLFLVQVKSDFTTCEDEDDCSSQFKCLKMEECSSSKICWH